MKLYFLFFLICTISRGTYGSVYTIDDSHGLGRRYDGFGAISGGGATSKLLVNYEENIRSQILDFLFKPNFGASLQILKVEIGGDGQSSEGAESSHMHSADDEDYTRGYEWWMMKEAKKRNPAIKLAGLPWSFPGWVGGDTTWPYTHPEVTAKYITKWVIGAQKYHNLSIDYIGVWNEKPYDVQYIKILRQMLDQASPHTQIIAADILGQNGFDIIRYMQKDPELNRSVSIVGIHYPGTNSPSYAQESHVQLWSSEDYSSLNDNEGAGCLATVLNKNYINGYFSGTITWNLIASYYDNLPYTRKGLMTAEEPWSGYYSVEPPIWITAHTTQFTSIGWYYLKHGSGVGYLDQGGSYVTYLRPGGDLTIVIETMTHDHSVCIRPPYPPYEVKPQNATFKIQGSMKMVDQLYLWYSALKFDGSKSTLFQQMTPVKVVNGQFSISVGLDSVYTLSTISTGHKGSFPTTAQSKPFPKPYKDSFDSYPVSSEAFNFAQQVGVFETAKCKELYRGLVLRQVVTRHPIHWCPLPLLQPINVIGNFNWSDITVTTDTYIDTKDGAEGAFIAARVDRGGCNAWLAQGVFFWILPDAQQFQISTDIARAYMVKSGNVKLARDTWYTLQLQVKGNVASAFVNKTLVFNGTVNSSSKHGFAAMGLSSFGYGSFDNFMVT
ncbi:unnamed protein product [Owenia fusiformis]|uniref:galactosylceramidase n=1 Tax=Owenia fusiformis TaxID=6347 RepID=A0A8J1XH93_OWEFU|nr:unnamed protein product [Owenia fusiformis]